MAIALGSVSFVDHKNQSRTIFGTEGKVGELSANTSTLSNLYLQCKKVRLGKSIIQ